MAGAVMTANHGFAAQMAAGKVAAAKSAVMVTQYHHDNGCGIFSGGNGTPCVGPFGPFMPAPTHHVMSSAHMSTPQQPVPIHLPSPGQVPNHSVVTKAVHHNLMSGDGGCMRTQPIHLPGDMPPPIHLPPVDPHHHDVRGHVPNPWPMTSGVPGGVINPFPVGVVHSNAVVHSNVGALPFK